MSLSEFDLIERYFTPQGEAPGVLVGVGDDAALLRVPADCELVVTTDTLLAGRHFPPQTTAADIARKALAVNFSDLAAMGAKPAWVTLALTLPEADPDWLQAFSGAFRRMLDEFGVALVGGDTTGGPLSVTVQAMGFCRRGQRMLRSQARPGDRILVTGTLGDAALGLHCLQNACHDPAWRSPDFAPAIDRLNHPQPRVAFGREAVRHCRAAIDLSDGLLADLGHVLSQSHCGARIHLPSLPVSETLQAYFRRHCQGQPDWSMIAAQGDDYELCLTAPADEVGSLMAIAQAQSLRLTDIGTVTDGRELLCLDQDEQPVTLARTGYRHFDSP